MADARVIELGERRLQLERLVSDKRCRFTNPVGDLSGDAFALSALEELVEAERELARVKRQLAAHFAQRWAITVRSRVLALISSKPEKTWALSVILKRVEASQTAIRQALHVLVTEEVIDHVDRGLYRLAIKHSP